MGTSSSGGGQDNFGNYSNNNTGGSDYGGSSNIMPQDKSKWVKGSGTRYYGGDGFVYNTTDGSRTRGSQPTAAPSSGGGGGGGGGYSGGGGSSRSSTIADDRADREAASAAALEQALLDARGGLDKEFQQYGINLGERGDQGRFGWEASSYNDQIDRYLNEITRKIDPLDENPSQYLNNYNQMFQDLRGNIEGETRGRLSRELGDFSNRSVTDARFGNDFGSDVTNSIYDDQYGNAQTTLDRAFKRGSLSQNAYDIALGDLGASSSGARDRLDSYRTGNLTDTRQELYDFGQKGVDNLSNFQLGGNFDVGGYQTQLNDEFGRLSGGFEGQLRNTIGGEKFFDTNSLIGAGHAGAGVENTKYNAPLWLQSKQETDTTNDQFRGIGSQGGF